MHIALFLFLALTTLGNVRLRAARAAPRDVAQALLHRLGWHFDSVCEPEKRENANVPPGQIDFKPT